MSGNRKILFGRLADCLPYSLEGIYNRFCKAPESVNWLSHEEPDGARSHQLWADPDAMVRWSKCRGFPLNSQKLARLEKACAKWAVEVRELAGEAA